MIGQKGIPAIHGGVEKHVHDLSVRLVARDNTVAVYARTWYTGHAGIDTVEGVTRIHTPTIKTKHLDTIVHVLTSSIHAVWNGYDVIHYHGVGPALLSWIPRVFSPKTRVITTLHSLDRMHQKWNWFARAILRLGEKAVVAFAHETITVSKSLQNYMKSEYEALTTYIPNGVEMPKKITTTTHLASFGLMPQNYIVMISRLVPHKGAHVLIEAFKQFKTRHADNTRIQSLKLAIVGGAAYTDDYVKSLHMSASAMNDIVFTDFQSGESLAELYQHATLMVHPSMNEGLPITVLQGMSYSIPVLLSSIPEHKEIIKDTRVFFKENDVESLVLKLEAFMKLNATEKQSMGRENRAIIAEKYNWADIVVSVEKVYRDSRVATHSALYTSKA